MNRANQNLSRFFPPSAREFQNKMDCLLAQAQAQADACKEIRIRLNFVLDHDSAVLALSGEVEKISEAIYSQIQVYQEIQKQLIEEQTLVSDKLNSLGEEIWSLRNHDYPLNVEFERKFYQNFPDISSQDFQEDFLSLVHGLDDESVETVILALQRVNIIRNSTDPYMALYSTKEKNIMRQNVEHFYCNIFQLANELYYYKGSYLPCNHFETSVFIDKCGIPYLEHPERLLESGIIDAGAFIGDSALVLSPLTNRKVYAFEPVPKNYAHMLETIKINSLSSVEPLQCALGAEKGKVSIAVSDSGSTQFENPAFSYEETVEAEVITIDEFVRDQNLQIGLIKADIEGAEQAMLLGAVETLKAQRPALLISIYHSSDDFFKIKPWLESLDLGYKFKIRHSVGGTVMTETILIAEV